MSFLECASSGYGGFMLRLGRRSLSLHFAEETPWHRSNPLAMYHCDSALRRQVDVRLLGVTLSYYRRAPWGI